MFLCLFGVLRPTQEFFTHIETAITGEGLQILSYAKHSCPLSSEGSIAFHINRDTRRASFYNRHRRRPETITPVAQRLALEPSLPVFTT